MHEWVCTYIRPLGKRSFSRFLSVGGKRLELPELWSVPDGTPAPSDCRICQPSSWSTWIEMIKIIEDIFITLILSLKDVLLVISCLGQKSLHLYLILYHVDACTVVSFGSRKHRCSGACFRGWQEKMRTSHQFSELWKAWEEDNEQRAVTAQATLV